MHLSTGSSAQTLKPRFRRECGQLAHRICELIFTSSDGVHGCGNGRVDNPKVANGSIGYPVSVLTVTHKNVRCFLCFVSLIPDGRFLGLGIESELFSRSDWSKTIRHVSVKGRGLLHPCHIYHKEFSRRKTIKVILKILQTVIRVYGYRIVNFSRTLQCKRIWYLQVWFYPQVWCYSQA